MVDAEQLEQSPVLPLHAFLRDGANPTIGAKVLKAPADYDYGLRDFDVADLDGNMIFFGMESKKS
jgi:hypothetical protein